MTDATHIVAPEELMAYLDGEISAARAQAVADHLRSCAECASLSQKMQYATRTLSLWKAGNPSSRLDDSIRAAAAKRSPQVGSLGTAIFQRTRDWTWKYWLAGFSAAAVILLFSFAIVPEGRRAASNVDSAKLFPEKAVRVVTEAQPSASARPAGTGQGIGYGRGAVGGDALQVKTLDGAFDAYTANGTVGKLGTGKSSQQEAWLQKEPMIARTASLAILVKDFDASRKSLDLILARHNAYSANLTANTPQGAARSLEASLRIPAPQLLAALAELKSLGRVENESQGGEEVTQQHADLVARLKNSRETEQRLQTILVQRTGKISDVLAVEQEIARVRGEIEEMEAEQKNLEHRVDFAAVELRISEEYKAQLNSPAPAISTQIHNALINGYRKVADSLLSLILFCAEYVPALVVWCAILLIPAWLIWRRWRHASASA